MTVGSVALEYADGRREMDRLHHGSALLELAHVLVSDLPAEALTFVASSVEGVALAATCAAIHGHDSDWQRLLLTVGAKPTTHPPVVVEPVDGGSGWKSAVLRRLPSARFVRVRERSLAAA